MGRCSNVSSLILLHIVAITCPLSVVGVLTTAQIDVSYIPSSSSFYGTSFRSALSGNGRSEMTLLASQASFGPFPPMKKDASKSSDYPHSLIPATALSSDALLCKTDEEMQEDGFAAFDKPTVLLVPRGGCSFEQKALYAQHRYKASAIIVYGDLSSRYGYNETSKEVIFPTDKVDYDCDYGKGKISKSKLNFNPKYDAYADDGLLASTCTANTRKCDSGKCLLTGTKTSDDYQTCCAWDLHIWLYADNTIANNTTETRVTIPSMYISMKQYDELAVAMANSKDMELRMYQRDRPYYNVSSSMIWALGVFTAAFAAYLSAMDIRAAMKRIQSRALIQMPTTETQQQIEIDVQSENLEAIPNSLSTIANNENTRTVKSRSPRPSPNATTSTSTRENEQQEEEETLELTLAHAFFFIVFSSASLLILFFFKLYSMVKVFYAFGCAGAMSQVLLGPLYQFIFSKFPSFSIHRTMCNISTLEIGPVSYLSVLSSLTAYGIIMVWLLMAFLHNNPSENPFFWITQDVMGMCICVVFLSLVRVSTLKVATVLLVVAFFYDIFFVFITPYIFKGKSVMITVATSGGPPTADPTWCEKYPKDKNCLGGDPLPMLLTFPRLFDYQGGMSLLGLGDIVLPGLALSFAARLDAAKMLIGTMSSSNSSEKRTVMCSITSCVCRAFTCNSYFEPIILAYAIGLLMANFAVYVMKMGQPALLYLVPMCLGSMFLVGWRKGEIRDLWNGSKMLRAADQIVKGGGYSPDNGVSTNVGNDFDDTELTAEARNDDDSFAGKLT